MFTLIDITGVVVLIRLKWVAQKEDASVNGAIFEYWIGSVNDPTAIEPLSFCPGCS